MKTIALKNLHSIIAITVLAVLAFAFYASGAGVQNPPAAGQASDTDLTTLAAPTDQTIAYGSGTSAVWVSSGTARTSNLLYSGVANSLLTQNASSGWFGQLGFGSVWPSIVANNTSASIKLQLAADNITTAGDHITRTADDFDLDANIANGAASFSILNASNTLNFQDGAIRIYFPGAVTITAVECGALQAGTTTIQLNERDRLTPGTAGSDVLSAQLVCGIETASTTAFANATIAANSFVSFDVDAMVGNPSSTAGVIYYSKDD